MRSGIWVLNIFAALWGAAAVLAGHLPMGLVVVPVALSVALLLWGRNQPLGTGNPVRGNRVGRVVGIATTFEIVAIVVAEVILLHLHLPTAIMPVAVVIVGLHFLPLAHWIPVRLFYRTGGALIAVGLIALVLPPPDRAVASGVAAALVLWASGVMLVRRGRG
ncbi:MAG: hypothetical protein M3R41_07355 [Pseudomonadota bacterium]|nr:hypothetical protein [Pseudomonadota bacterium]